MNRLAKDYDLLVMEGAGSCCEMNLKQNDLVNFPMARQVGAPCILIGDIDRGGILGICGGYQLLGEIIRDPFGVESDKKEVRGLGLLPMETVLEVEKVVRKITGTCLINKKRVSGYEIHMGRNRTVKKEGEPFLSIHEPGKRRAWEDGWSLKEGKISGTYVHSILDSPAFRGDFLNRIRRAKGLQERPPKQGRLGRFHLYDKLAGHFEKHCKVEEILTLI